MQAVKDENYYVVHGWMKNRLGLSGSELVVFAIMYGFCQDQAHEFKGSLNYIADWMGAKTRHTVVKAIDGLVAKGYIEKENNTTNAGGHGANTYKVNFMLIDEMKNNQDSSLKTEPPLVQKMNKGVQKMHKPCAENAQGDSAKNAQALVQKMHNNNKDIYKDKYKDSNKDIYIAPSPKQTSPYEKIVDMYHEYCKSLPSVKIISEKRKKAIKVLWNEFNGEMNMFLQLFSMAEESDFLTGRDGKWSTGANFDWIMNKNNAIKVIEGNYENKNKLPNVKRPSGKNDVSGSLEKLNELFGVSTGEDYDTIPTTAL